MEWVFYTRTPYLFECGVLHRLSDSRFCQNLFVDKRNNSTLSFYMNPSLGVGDTTLLEMASKVKTAKEINLEKAVKEALKDCPSLMSSTVVSTEAVDGIDISGCYDENGNGIESDCVENCKSGNFSAKIRVNLSNEMSLVEDIFGIFEVTGYDAQLRLFKVKILQVNQK